MSLSLAAAAAAAPVVLVGGALACSVARTLYLCWKWRAVPGPTPHLLLGNVVEMRRCGGLPFACMKWKEQYGPIFKIIFFGQVFIVVVDPEAARQVMSKCLNHSPFSNPSFRLQRGVYRQLDEEGLLQSRDDLWRVLRAAWQPTFAPTSLKGYAQLMRSCAQKLQRVIGAGGYNLGPAPSTLDSPAGALSPRVSTSGGPSDDVSQHGDPRAGYLDIHDLLSRLTLDVVGTTAYGVEFCSLPGEAPPTAIGAALHEACKDTFLSTTSQGASLWGLAALIFPVLLPIVSLLAHILPDRNFKKIIAARVNMLHGSVQLMESWRHTHPGARDDTDAQPSATTAVGTPAVGVAPGSFLGLLLSAQQRLPASSKVGSEGSERLSDVTIAAQCATFFLAGTETTANTLAFAIYLIATHPEVETQLVEELRVHGPNTPVGPDDMMPWTDAIICEALRLYPPAHATTRDLESDEGLQIQGHHFARGTKFLVSMYTIHHDAALWPRVEEFLPQRWLKQCQSELGPRHQGAYCPFGGGSRLCPGNKFALQEARIVLATLYAKYTFQLAPGQVPLQIASGLTLSPKGGILVRAVPRLW